MVRATESAIELSGEIVTAKSVVNTVRYYYDTEGKLVRKVIAPTGGEAHTVYYTNTDNSNTTVKFSAGGRTVTSHSKNDSFGRKTFDELQLGTDFVSRQFVYLAGEVTQAHKDKAKVKSSATTQLVSQIILSNGTTLSYGYDAEERITSVTETYTVDEQTVTNTTTYTYDALGQLLTETVNNEVVNSMTYDSYGNIKSKNGKAYTYGDGNWKDLLTSYNGQAITYDAQGNPLKYLGHTLTWEKGRQLKSFGSNTYTYNANGIRTSKTVGGVKHTYILEGTKILREEWNGNTLIPLYDNEDSVCGILYNKEPFYFQKNLQGDIIAIVDKNGDTVARYTYDAWGVPAVTQDSSACQIAAINPYRYRGYYYDAENGLYYLQSRYYDPVVGRFVNADIPSFILGVHINVGYDLMTYCFNSPTNHKDNCGYWAQNYAGFVRTSAGFNVNYNSSFLRKTFCRSYANNVIWLYGGWTWLYGYAYKKMNAMRIAKELYANAILYCIGAGLLAMSIAMDYLSKIIEKIAGKRALAGLFSASQMIVYLQRKLGIYLFDHSRVINVNNNEKWYRVVIFELLWML